MGTFIFFMFVFFVTVVIIGVFYKPKTQGVIFKYLGGHPDLVTVNWPVTITRADDKLRFAFGKAGFDLDIKDIVSLKMGHRKHDESVVILTVKYGVADLDILLGGDYLQTKYTSLAALLRHQPEAQEEKEKEPEPEPGPRKPYVYTYDD